MAYTLRGQGPSRLERHGDRERKGRVRSLPLPPPQSRSRELNTGTSSHSHHHYHYHYYYSAQDSGPLDRSWAHSRLDSQVTLNAVKYTVQINHQIQCPTYSSLPNFPRFNLGSPSSTQFWDILISHHVCVTIKETEKKIQSGNRRKISPYHSQW